MSAARFEIVRTDAEQPWHARFRASNGKVQFVSENYTRRSRALAAIANLARTFSPTEQVWISTTRQGRSVSSEIRYGVTPPTDTYTTARRLEVRDIDAREATS